MKELLLQNKPKLVRYIIACFYPVINDLMQIFLIAMIFEAVDRGTMEYFNWTVIASIAFVFLSSGIFIASRMMRISFMNEVILSVRIRAFDKILAMSYKHFNKKSKDVYISNLMNDINTFEKDFFISLLNIIYISGVFVVISIILLFLNWQIGLIIIGVSLLVLLISKLFEKKTVVLQQELSTENEKFTVNASNTFNGLEILKLNNIEDKFLGKSKKQIIELEDHKLKFNLFTALQTHLNEAIGTAVLFGLIIFLLYNPDQALGYGTIVLIIELSANVVFSLTRMMPLLNVIQSSKSIYDKITAKEEGEAEKNGRENPFSFKHDITVKNLTFSYEGKNVFKYLNFTLEKGKKYLLKGPSGVGKTTLIKLLSMSYDDYEGSITIDGKDLQTIRLDDFNKNVSFIYQDVFLFEASIFENISLFKNIDPKRVMDSAISAGLEDFLKQEPDSINTRISENGKNLSGGERQRISIARALCKEAEILFVDEATASLNDDLGRSIEQTILNLDATVVAISHKFFQGITSQYDYVLELKDGYINQYAASDYFSEDGQNEKENNVL